VEETVHIQKIINKFIDASQKHYISTIAGNSRATNNQAKKIRILFTDIQSIGIEAREALLEQVNNDEDSVAIMAATYSLKYNTEKSMSALKRISEKNSGILGFGARQCMQRWEEGVWQLE